MLLNLMCSGAAISFNNFEALFNASGNNATITLNDAHMQPPPSLHSLMKSAGDKQLVVAASATVLSPTQMAALINSTAGRATELELGSINSYPAESIALLVGTLAGKAYSLEVSCLTVNAGNVGPLMDALTGTAESLTFSSANAVSHDVLNVILARLGNQAANFEVNGQLSSAERVIGAVSQISQKGFSSVLINPQYVPFPQLPAVLAAASDQGFQLYLDLEFFPSHMLKDLIRGIGRGTTVCINGAHIMRTAELIYIIGNFSGRRLVLIFNGRQLTIDPVDGDKLQQVINASSSSHTISVNTAQYPPLSYLLPLIESSAHTNLTLSYNGNQLSETEPHGNVVVRGIQVAQKSTSIIITSVGARNFILSHYLGILAAAG